MASPATPDAPRAVMSAATAEQWLISSAAVVAGVYAYMRYKGKSKTSIGTFAVSWGTIYFLLALVTEASPSFGGSFAILVMVSDLLANTPSLADLVKQGQTDKKGNQSTGSNQPQVSGGLTSAGTAVATPPGKVGAGLAGGGSTLTEPANAHQLGQALGI